MSSGKLPARRTVMGGLSGAVALAAGSQAYAIAPVAVPSNLASSLGTTTTTAWDVDGNAVADYAFQFRFPNSTGTLGVVWQGNMNPNTALGNAVQGYLGPFVNYGTNLSVGQNVGPVPAVNSSFRTATQVTLGSIYRSGGIPSDYGGFRPGTSNYGGAGPGASTGYVGFRLGAAGPTARFGWLKLTLTQTGITFDSAALGAPGEAVQAGIVPEPTSLAALAFGAVAFMRRPRKQD